jgi:hypothetical protein
LRHGLEAAPLFLAREGARFLLPLKRPPPCGAARIPNGGQKRRRKEMQRRFTLTGTVAAVVLTVLFFLPPGAARAGVYDDAAAWWHFDYDPDADGFAGLDEIRDQCDWGTAAAKGAGGKHATAVRGVSGGPRWTDAPAVCPAGGQGYGRKSMLFQTAVDPATSNCWPDTFLVSDLRLPGSATLMTRFRWEGYPTELEKLSWLFNSGVEWNKYWGWLFGVVSNDYPRLAFYTQKREFIRMDVRMTNSVWYDAAIVLTDGGPDAPDADTVEFYLWPENGTLSYRKYTTDAVTNEIGTMGCIVGCETSPTGYAAGNARKSFIL